MDADTIRAIINEAVAASNQLRTEDRQIDLDPYVTLFGPDGKLDSMTLVALLLDVEDAFLEHGIEISLSDERAMSESRSPFRSIETLENYIVRLLQDS